MRRVAVAAALAAVLALASAACGPAQCYSGCTDARPLVDFVILVDDSGSMRPYKDGIVNGLNTWAQSLSKMNAAYSIVTFGNYDYDPRIVQQMTTDFAEFKTQLANGITLDGGWEAGFEAIRCIAKTANIGNLNINWRDGATRVLILLTDEDSDPASFQANRVQSSSTTDYLCRSKTGLTGNSYSWTTQMTATQWNKFQQEIDLAVTAVKTAKFSHVYMLVNPNKTPFTCNTFSQYGNPLLQVQANDLSNFNIAATLAKIDADTNESKYSLQGQLLRSSPQILSRVFDVGQAATSNFVNNFFAAVTADVSQCDRCLRYDCAGNKCQDPVNICDCNGQPGGNAVVDCNGVCGGTAVRDCAGVCNGNAQYDACDICTANGAQSPLCRRDCDNNLFVSSRPSSAFLKTCASTPTWFKSFAAQAGYIVASNDLKIAGAAGKWTAEQICSHFRTDGQFEGRNTCQFDEAYYWSSNPSFSTASYATAAEHYVKEGLRVGANARCKDQTTAKLPPRAQDNCGQCVSNPLSPPYCQLDCLGHWHTSQGAMHVVDDCGVCNGNNAAKDACGVCNGKNATMDPCGVCNGTFGIDGCGHNLCDATRPACLVDCKGNSYNSGEIPPYSYDECKQCVATGGRDPNCKTDCKNIWYLEGTDLPAFEPDQCGNCMPRGQTAASCVQDCLGHWGGDGKLDACGQCVSSHPSAPATFACLSDCNGAPYKSNEQPPHVVDNCEQCVDSNDPAAFDALKDNCGVCTNLVGYDSATQCVQDCDDQWRNVTDPTRPVVDDCNDCIAVDEKELFNRRRNGCGVCVAADKLDDPVFWYDGQLQDTNGAWCSCGVDPMPCADGTTSCSDCPPPNKCPGGSDKDACGHCPGDDMFNKKDKCGICCGNYGNTTGLKCDLDVDECGVCFGLNANKTTNICNVCDPKDCIVDCAGVPFGTAVYDCAGICGGNSICAVCGNGVVENGEACDDGAANGSGGCTTECTVVSGALTGGQIAGAVIGAIAAVALVAALALFGWRYAVSNGLFGTAKSKVDMGASNSNPLYESETKVASNPLYAGN